MKPIVDWDKYERGYKFREKTWYSQYHLGLDICCPSWTPLYAPFNGVSKDNSFTEGGNVIDFYANGYVFRMMHLAKISKTGEVKEGELIGYTGNSGTLTTGSHLHIDISKNSVQINNINNFLDPETFNWGGDDMTKDQAIGLMKGTLKRTWIELTPGQTPDQSSIDKEAENSVNKYLEKGNADWTEDLITKWAEDGYKASWMPKAQCNESIEKEKADNLRLELGNTLTAYEQTKKELSSVKSDLNAKENEVESLKATIEANTNACIESQQDYEKKIEKLKKKSWFELLIELFTKNK